MIRFKKINIKIKDRKLVNKINKNVNYHQLYNKITKIAKKLKNRFRTTIKLNKQINRMNQKQFKTIIIFKKLKK